MRAEPTTATGGVSEGGHNPKTRATCKPKTKTQDRSTPISCHRVTRSETRETAEQCERNRRGAEHRDSLKHSTKGKPKIQNQTDIAKHALCSHLKLWSNRGNNSPTPNCVTQSPAQRVCGRKVCLSQMSPLTQNSGADKKTGKSTLLRQKGCDTRAEHPTGNLKCLRSLR